MTPKEITTLAGHRLVPPWVMKLAMDVAAAEREACAKMCEEIGGSIYVSGRSQGADFCAAAIRARSEK